MSYCRFVSKTLKLFNSKSIHFCNDLGQTCESKLSQTALLNRPWQATQVRYKYWRNVKPRTPYTKPLSFDYSGDLQDHVMKIDKSELRPGYEEVEELKNVDEATRKLFSLEFSTHSVHQEKILGEVIKQIQDHPLDVRSIEVEIARATVNIRNQIKHCVRFRHDFRSIAMLRARISHRNDALGRLLIADSEKFDWLTEKLQLKYTPPSKYQRFEELSKRATRKKVARDAAISLVKQKSQELIKKLEEEKERFEKYKEQELIKIEEELKELGIEKAESLAETLKALDQDEMVPRKAVIPSRRKLIYEKRLELLMKKKEGADEKIFKANNFLTPKEFPAMPNDLFY